MINKPNIGQHLPPFAQKVIAKLARFDECVSDGQGADIGRHWLDLLTQLGLLNRVQRSPGLWEISHQGEDVLEARSAQPADQQVEPAAWLYMNTNTGNELSFQRLDHYYRPYRDDGEHSYVKGIALYTRTDAEYIALLERDHNVHCKVIHDQGVEIATLRAAAKVDDLLRRTLPYLSNTPDLVQAGAEELAAEIRANLNGGER